VVAGDVAYYIGPWAELGLPDAAAIDHGRRARGAAGSFERSAALELIERERVTFIPSAPASIIAMLNDPELTRFDLSSLRVVITGGASCPIETIRAHRAHMPGHLIELYGMLETGFHAHAPGGRSRGRRRHHRPAAPRLEVLARREGGGTSRP
jgi:acyl-CoA synthetase (AMP-forming)/AMP-acid ligase II